VPTSRAFDKLLIANPRSAQLATVAGGSGTPPGPTRALASRFESFATTIQNRIDSDSGGSASLGGSLNAQVTRALNQATRRGTTPTTSTSGAYGGPQAAGSATPVFATGAITAAAPRSAQLPAAMSLPPDQRSLAGEATITQQDLLSSLDAVQPLSVEPSPDDIAAYKNVIRAQVIALVGEFSRPDLPRPPRVRVLLGGLLGFAFPAGVRPTAPPPTDGKQTGDLAALIYLLKRGRPRVTSASLDEQQALREILSADGVRLLELWSAYQYRSAAKPPPMWLGVGKRRKGVGGSAAVGKRPPSGVSVGRRPGPLSTSYSQRLINVNLLLPNVVQDTAQVAGALDAVGFGPGQQETVPIGNVISAVDSDLFTGTTMPILQAREPTGGKGPTVKDLLDWAAELSDAPALDVIGQAGQLGINLLADQADELFFIILDILGGANVQPVELRDPQVRLELISLARDLSELADQGI
jgi:hypothetical protein